MNIILNNNENRARAGWRLLLQIICMVLLVGIVTLAMPFTQNDTLKVISILPQFLGVIASLWIAARFFDKRRWQEYGLSFNAQWFLDAFAGAVIAAAAVAVIFLVEWYLGWIIITDYGWNTTSEISFTTGMISSLGAMLMVSFYEELFSRGYQILNLTEGLQYPQLGERGGVAIAVLLSSSLFGILHFFNPSASATSTGNIILAGIVLALPYILTGSLALSVGLHFGWNFTLGAIAGFPVSGFHFEASVITIKQLGSSLWTGGRFGPEAGLIVLLGLGVMAGGAIIYIQQQRRELTIHHCFTKKYQSPHKADELKR
ncbi:hypothetical protein LX73_1500 [Fodinibius salinus]|uniref:CAAX prenyl protease 2/Lysostaphin resistance protein A-like domain-containing protein n=1 Tax=Fodinibius salinus TaxID=860790 RepID=A0A5D3YNR3_9BACT|nr:type II CAAX endopeptidase family protein [Fodinibius salinus]TYP93789.1 hypothetical protein LX73_1500 [Fodinibius salinus]